MLLPDPLVPNKHQYSARSNGKYLSTRLLTHNGITVAFALGRKAQSQQLFFDYSVLNFAGQEPTSGPTEQLDSDCWFENVKPLLFASEVRVVGEEAVPVFKIPAWGLTGLAIGPEQIAQIDPWASTSLGLMDTNVTNFEVLSDGRYIYLFRQSRCDPLPDQPSSGKAPIDNNLLCDRFNLVGDTLKGSLEVRYQRSSQKRLPKTILDTLGVQTLEGAKFFEPTFSLRFIKNLFDGRFSVLQAPTMTNDVKKWMFFVYSERSHQIECFTTDIANDGLFDIHGQIYYTCDSDDHEQIFSNTPGACTACSLSKGEPCGEAKSAIIPKSPLSDRAISLFKTSATTNICLKKPIDFSEFPDGFTLEAWICSASFWIDDSAQPEDGSHTEDTNGNEQTPPPVLPPAGSSFCLFSLSGGEQSHFPSVFLDDHLRIVLRENGESPILLASEQSVEVDTWFHVAITYTTLTRSFTLAVDGATPSSSSFYVLPKSATPGSLRGMASQLGKYRFQGRFDEVRLWSHALHPATVKAKMSTRVIGMEPLLESCWHFDEGTGNQAFDATKNGHDIDLFQDDRKMPLPSQLWAKSTAPMASNIGLSKRVLRLDPNITITGGLHAALYHEQVSLVRFDISGTKTAAAQPLKRSARVLLCFVASKSGSISHLAVLDFALLNDGTLCDSPATFPMPSLSTTTNLQGTQRVSTPQLYVDAQGMEVFGGFLAFDVARCTGDSPCVWDSATGSITIFFRSISNTFSAITYDISRSMELTSILGLSEGQELSASSKLRQAINIEITTSPSRLCPETVAVDLMITATMIDDTKIIEKWNGKSHTFVFLFNAVFNVLVV